jgi:hypothetical protein
MSNGVFYADAVNGNDANDGLSEATAKQTISAGLGLFSGGNNVLYLQATGDYVLSSMITLNQTGSLAVGANRIEGYTTTPGARDGRPSIVGSTTGVDLFQFGSGTMYIDLVHLRFADANVAFLPGLGATGGPSWVDCVCDNCFTFMYGDYGAYWYIYGSLYNCEIKNCRGYGILNESPLNLFDCWIHDNAGEGITYYSGGQAGGTWWIVRCLITDNGSYGMRWADKPDRGVVIDNCIIANNGSDGVRAESVYVTGTNLTLRNSIIYGNGGYGVRVPAAGVVGVHARNWRLALATVC